jgi:hypothetical protein
MDGFGEGAFSGLHGALYASERQSRDSVR